MASSQKFNFIDGKIHTSLANYQPQPSGEMFTAAINEFFKNKLRNEANAVPKTTVSYTCTALYC